MVNAGFNESQKIKKLIAQANKYINMLYSAPCRYSRDSLLFKLESIMAVIEDTVNVANEEINGGRTVRQRDFNIEELSKYTGKNGNPAYVAVNGIVYDVTSNAAWAAATHFGLTAGRDLTTAFTSCHVSPSILEKLTIVGKFV